MQCHLASSAFAEDAINGGSHYEHANDTAQPKHCVSIHNSLQREVAMRDADYLLRGQIRLEWVS